MTDTFPLTDTFPRQQARTQKFSLGVPRSFHVSADGRRIVFLRSKTGTDSATCLWVLDLPDDVAAATVTDGERLVVDASAINGAGDEPEEERARRERSREKAGGVVAFATDAGTSLATFALGGKLYVSELGDGGEVRELEARAPVIDPRLDPAGARVAYVSDGALRIADLTTGADSELIGPGTEPDVTYGLAEFVAAEEMHRFRGYWWAPDGTALLVARVDNGPVQRWYVADPAHPDAEPTVLRYPSAGTANADVSLLVVGLDGSTVPVRWDGVAFPYLTSSSWDKVGPLIVVQSRDQKRLQVLAVNAVSGETETVRADFDPRWLDLVPGVPARLDDGRIVWTGELDNTRRLLVAPASDLASGPVEPVTPAGLQVRSVLSVDGDTVLFSASDREPSEIGAWAYGTDGLRRVSAEAAGLGSGVRSGGTTVLTWESVAEPGVSVTVLREGRDSPAAVISSVAERPSLMPRVTFLRAGERALRTALILPSWYEPGSGGASLPVLMDPYGGPHAQRAVAASNSHLTSQWFADQGFAVIVADGRGTPGRGPGWDRSVAGDLAGPPLEDQADALASVAEQCERDGLARLDLTKVGIRGWSFGGYLAALAVLRRPDVFHAAVAGAPVTEWRLYDTHYTERYLGNPNVDGAVYDASSLTGDASKLTRPLLIIHGLADDNVVLGHTVRLSAALLAAGKPHSVLPLSGVTHMATQEDVAENLLLLQVDFLKRALGVAG